MAFSYPFTREGDVNAAKLTEEINAINPSKLDGFAQAGSTINVIALIELSPAELDTVEQVIANHDPADLTAQQEIDQARAGLSEVRQYLLLQLVKAAPDAPAQQVTAIKQIANGNTYLTNAMTNQINEMNDAFSWTLTLNPNNLTTRRQFVFTVKVLTGVLPQA